MKILPPTMFDLTVRALKEAEERVLALRPTPAILNGILRVVLFPFPFMQVGFVELTRPAVVWVSIFGALIVAVAFCVPHLGLTAQDTSYISLACILVPMFLVAFAVPSTFSFDGIKGGELRALADYLHSQGIDNAEKIEALQDTLDIVADRAMARVKSLQWVVATVWALFLFGLNQFISIAMKVEPVKVEEIVPSCMTAFIGYGIAALLCTMAIITYKKGIDAVFRRLQYSIRELKYRAANGSAVTRADQ